MTVTFTCQCGKILSGEDRETGMRGVCPNCGRDVVVPAASTSSASGTPFEKSSISAVDIETWIFSHQRQIAVAAVLLGVVAVSLMVVLKFSSGRRTVDTSSDPSRHEETIDNSPAIADLVDPAEWQTSYAVFASALQEAIREKRDPEAPFQGRRIRWDVTFRELKNREDLYFLESEPLERKNRAVKVAATLLPSEVNEAERLRRGDAITLGATVASIVSARTTEHRLEVYLVTLVEGSVARRSEGSPATSE